MHMTYILIDCSLSKMYKWRRNKDSLYHDGTAFFFFFTATIIPAEILGIFLWNECLYHQYSLPEHVTFSDFQQ